MNKKNNKRRQATVDKIEQVFVQLLQTKALSQITVSEICQHAEINRSTFYANFMDVYDLADKIRDKLEAEVEALYQHDFISPATGNDYLRLFQHMRDNRLFYITYFKLGYDTAHQVNLYDLYQANVYFDQTYIEYHLAFFKAGFNAMVKLWLERGCRESPEEMAEILKSEYQCRDIQ